MYIKMIHEILQNHETTLENVKHVFYSNSNNGKLFISFAGKIDKYVSVTWFYNQYEFLGNFLFLKNNENYNTYNEEKYEKLIKYYIEKLNIHKLITYGPSMGGIASIMYGLKFNADIIISIDPNPIEFDYHILLDQIRNYTNNFDYKTKIFLSYTFLNDYETLYPWTIDIIDELKMKNLLVTLHPFRCIEHLSFIPSKDFLTDIIKLNDGLKVRNYTQPAQWI